MREFLASVWFLFMWYLLSSDELTSFEMSVQYLASVV